MKTIILALGLFGQFALAQTSTIPRPTMPTYAQCAPRDSSCEAANRALRDNYNNEVRGYNEAVRLQNEELRRLQANQTTTDTQAAADAIVLNSQSTRANLQAAVETNKKGGKIYDTAAEICKLTSAGFMGAYIASCAGMGATCNHKLLASSMAFAAFSVLAKSQSKSHKSSALAACNSSNQVSTVQENCNALLADTNSPLTGGTTNTGIVWPQGSTEVLPLLPDGTCTGTAEQCQTIVDNLPPGTNLRDVATGLSGFATNGRSPFTIDPNTGVITTKDGKKIDPSVFGDSKKMGSALGMSPMEAQGLLSDLNSKTGGLSGNVAGTGSGKNGSSKDSGISSGTSIGGGGTQTIGVQSQGRNGDLTDADGTDIAGSGKGDGTDGDKANRSYASAEGLVKDFNGEMIGVAGDDIFKMMNRRYNLKATQDSFIGP